MIKPDRKTYMMLHSPIKVYYQNLHQIFISVEQNPRPVVKISSDHYHNLGRARRRYDTLIKENSLESEEVLKMISRFMYQCESSISFKTNFLGIGFHDVNSHQFMSDYFDFEEFYKLLIETWGLN